MPEPIANQDAHQPGTVLLRLIPLILAALSSLVLLGVTLRYVGYGIDLSDEGFYLNSIANPAAFPVNVPPSLFGFLWHGPYSWLDGDVAALRLINVLVTFVLSWFLCWCVTKRFWTGWQGILIATAFSALGLASYRWWLLTPNYNSLTFQALTIILTGLLLVDSREWLARAGRWLLISLDGWLSALSKPTVALAAGLVVLIYILVWHRNRVLPLLAAAALSLIMVIVSAYIIDGGPVALTARLLRGVQATTLLGSGHDLSLILRIDALNIDLRQIVIALTAGLLFFAALKWRSFSSPVAMSLLAIPPIIATIIALTGDDPVRFRPEDLFLLPLSLTLGAVAGIGGESLRRHSSGNVALAIIFLTLPHIFALGTNNNYWVVASLAGIFWLLAAVIFVAPMEHPTTGIGA